MFQFSEMEKEETMQKMQYMLPHQYQWAAAHGRQYCPPLSSCSPPPSFSSVQPVGYYSVGYPQHDDTTNARIIGKYKNVVMELEDAKL